MSAVASSFGSSSATPPEKETTPSFGKRALSESCLQSIEERFGVAAVRDREEHAEAPSRDPARQVTRAADVVEHTRHRRKHLVRRKMADARVDGGQTVDVEHQQREGLAASAGSTDLAIEKRVECRTVVEIRERVAIGHGIGLAQLERGLECGSRDAEDVLERRDVDLAELPIRRPCQHCEHARVVRRVEERDRETVPDRIPVARRVVAVERDLDRTRATVVGNAEPADLRDLALGQADRREDRLLLRPDDRDGGIGGRLFTRELEDADDVRVVGPSTAGASTGVPEIAAVIRAGSVWLRASLSVWANSARRWS